MNERIDVNKVLEGLAEANAIDEYGNAGVRIEACLRQQQAEIEALKKTCLDEITKRIYADQTTKVIEGYWEEAQAEIEALNRFIAERGETGQLIIWKAQEK